MFRETFKDMFFKKKTRLLSFKTGIQFYVNIHKHELTILLPGAHDSHNQPNVISPADLKCSHQPPNATLVIMLLPSIFQLPKPDPFRHVKHATQDS